ncbi:FERM, ARHGEF and pleckstrin domain-containing protein 1 isoform X4 [Drosophila gunungcola]|uniref:FERM, ARHGEF and pleckstrin domain-containing protein 1 isoform X4 n=1 Tax=Drosophila gunungcola TaxID=103775 RepID=UPI0022E43E67|nr:FERM, ARHGEF and pleckstrin domain-containing protein 1 isoform X4 [Drosophila gunungcola]
MSLADMGTASRSAGGGGGGRHYDLATGGGGGHPAGGGLPGGRMTHSLSTPSGVDGTPSTPRHRGGKKLTVRIQMLDDSITMFQVQAKAMGRVLFEQVCRQLNLLEADYFGLEYQEVSTHTKYWLDLEKPMNRQVGLSLIDPVLRFCIKFYTPDPAQLEEEYTRYLFCLQIKRDLATGSLQCNDNTAALMASYVVQASCGDFVPEDYPDHTYLSSYRFVPHQDATMQRKIMENHKKHVGQSPAEADLNLLETARRCELYGMKMHPAKDVEGVPLNLAVAHMGITVFQNITRINTFSWAKIRKISFKRKRFLVKLHPEGYGYYKDTVEFFFEGRNECKNFWKKCVENHGFFRCTTVQNTPRRKTRVLSRGSSFRYSGKTQKQIIEFVRENYVKRQNFQSGMGLSQSMQRLDDPFSDEEGSGYLGSPTRQSYRPHAFSSHSSPGGDLSDEELCSGLANLPGGSGMLGNGGGTATPLGSGYGPNEFEPLAFAPGSAVVDFAQPQQPPPTARSRSGSCASRRSQFRSEPLVPLVQQQHPSSSLSGIPSVCPCVAAAHQHQHAQQQHQPQHYAQHQHSGSFGGSQQLHGVGGGSGGPGNCGHGGGGGAYGGGGGGGGGGISRGGSGFGLDGIYHQSGDYGGSLSGGSIGLGFGLGQCPSSAASVTGVPVANCHASPL